jgi:hypothetical protein
VAGFCKYGDEPAGSGSTELVIPNNSQNLCFKAEDEDSMFLLNPGINLQLHISNQIFCTVIYMIDFCGQLNEKLKKH